MKIFFKSKIHISLILIVFITCFYSISSTIYADEKVNNTQSSKLKQVEYNENLSKQIESNEEYQNRDIVTVAAVVSVAVAACALAGYGYNAGKYAAKKCHKRLGLTTKMYKKYRWRFRIAISYAINPIVALGFDDYYLD